MFQSLVNGARFPDLRASSVQVGSRSRHLFWYDLSIVFFVPVSDKYSLTEVVLMAAWRSYYQFIFFVKHNVFPSPEMFSLMLDMYKGHLPSVRFCPAINASLPPLRLLHLHHETKLREILFEPERISIAEKYEYGDFPASQIAETVSLREDFVSYVEEILNVFFITQNALLDNSCQGYRMSLVTQLLFDDVSENALNRAFGRLVNTVESHREVLPVEWSVRQCSRIMRKVGENEELLNLISNIGRVRRSVPPGDGTKEFDTLDLLCEINTFQGIQKQRFADHDAREFLLNTAFDCSGRIEREAGELLDE